MNKLLILVFIFFSCISCQNYSSEKYIRIEDEAINDIILEMIKFKEMNRLFNAQNKKQKLYIISTLDTITARTDEPEGFTIRRDCIDLSAKIIEQNKKRYEKELAKYKREENLFSNLKNGKIKKRILNYPLKYEKLTIEYIKDEDFKNSRIAENEIGYLFISRIIFTKNFKIGHLHFFFICGAGCAWDNNIEIEKVNGKWKITKYLSGGMA